MQTGDADLVLITRDDYNATKQQLAELNTVVEQVVSVDVDALSPLDALTTLYRLKRAAVKALAKGKAK